MTRSVERAWLAVVAAVLLLIALPGLADSQARIVRLSDVRGDVEIDRHSGQGFERAILNMPVTQAMLLRTGSDGRTEVEFEDGTVMRLAPESEVDFQQLSLRDSGAKASTIEVNQGIVYFSVHHHSGDEFTARFAGREVPVTRSSHFRVDVTPTNIKLAVFKGKLWLEQDGNKVEVKKGEELSLDLDTDSNVLARNIEPNEYDEWDQQRLDYHEQYYSNSSYSSYPYYGRGDLNYYGGWYNVPGYGALWQPYDVAFGWSPFSSGYWCWYPAFGYTWVSPYPWGWLPYRYGSWVWVPGWGWGWMPGTYWTYWNPYPRVVDPPPAFTAPLPPTRPNRPTILVGTSVPNRPEPVPRGRVIGNTNPDQPHGGSAFSPSPARPPRVSVSPTVDASRRMPAGTMTTSPSAAPMPAPRRSVGATPEPAPRSTPPPSVSTPRTAPSVEIPRSPRATPAPEAPRSAPPPSMSAPRTAPSVEIPRSPRATPAPEAPRSAPAVDTPRAPRSTPPPSSNFRPSMNRSMGMGSAERSAASMGRSMSMGMSAGSMSRGSSGGGMSRSGGGRRP